MNKNHSPHGFRCLCAWTHELPPQLLGRLLDSESFNKHKGLQVEDKFDKSPFFSYLSSGSSVTLTVTMGIRQVAKCDLFDWQ